MCSPYSITQNLKIINGFIIFCQIKENDRFLYWKRSLNLSYSRLLSNFFKSSTLVVRNAKNPCIS